MLIAGLAAVATAAALLWLAMQLDRSTPRAADIDGLAHLIDQWLRPPLLLGLAMVGAITIVAAGRVRFMPRGMPVLLAVLALAAFLVAGWVGDSTQVRAATANRVAAGGYLLAAVALARTARAGSTASPDSPEEGSP
jgi:hypothetical protein